MPICDWLICGHVAIDKCNVSRRATSKQLLPAPYIQKQNAALNLQVSKCFFKFILTLQNLKETKNTQQATGNAVETL